MTTDLLSFLYCQYLFTAKLTKIWYIRSAETETVREELSERAKEGEREICIKFIDM
jgi:hypothetical protein